MPQDTSVITIKEARKLLGKEFRGVSDNQISDIVNLLDVIARDIVQTVPE